MSSEVDAPKDIVLPPFNVDLQKVDRVTGMRLQDCIERLDVDRSFDDRKTC